MTTSREALREGVALLLERRARWSRRRLGLVLVYHRLGEQPGDARFDLVPAVGHELFEAELAHLARRYRVVRASDVVAAAAVRRPGDRFPVAVTFDDDLVSHAELAAPALRAAGLTATFFLTGASPVERPRRWWDSLQIVVDRRLVGPDDLPHLQAGLVKAALDREPHAIRDLARVAESLPPEDLETLEAELDRRTAEPTGESGLTTERVRVLARDGFEIGFHTRGHRLLTTLDEPAVRVALVAGKREFEEQIDASISLLAYPHGKADERVAAAAADSGYTLAFTGSREPVRPSTHRFLVGRFEPRADTLGRFALELARAVASA
jgi:peptidoglycan/xylan/chitin deacetylase (PgdA/CDA1 family)